MTTIYDVYTFLRFLTDETRSGHLSPEETSTFLEAGQLAVFDRYWLKGYGSNQTSTEALKPFTKKATSTSDTTGLLAYPTGFAHKLSIRTTLPNGRIAFYHELLDNEAEFALNSKMSPIADNPRYQLQAEGGQLYPSQRATVDFRYLKVPDSPVIGYTPGAGGSMTYNSGTSVQLGFDKKYWIEIILETLPYVGLNLSNADVLTLAAQWQQQKNA